jgi:opacity protein-like surface antigen
MRRGIALAVVVAVLATAAVAWAVVPKGPDTYEGKTGQNKAVFVKVNDKSRIKAFLIEYKAKCSDGHNYGGSILDRDKQGNRITQQNGVFSGTAKKTEDAGGGYKGHVTLTYEGKFTTATAANGTAKIKVKVTYYGDKVASCSKSPKWHVPE